MARIKQFNINLLLLLPSLEAFTLPTATSTNRGLCFHRYRKSTSSAISLHVVSNGKQQNNEAGYDGHDDDSSSSSTDDVKRQSTPPRSRMKAVKRRKSSKITSQNRSRREIEMDEMRRKRQQKYEEMRQGSQIVPSIWSFESLFPEPFFDENQVEQDLEEASLVKKKEKLAKQKQAMELKAPLDDERKVKSRENEFIELQEDRNRKRAARASNTTVDGLNVSKNQNVKAFNVSLPKVDWEMSRRVEDRMYGIRRDPINGQPYDETSLMGDGAVQFRDGVRLGKALRVNLDRLNYFAKKDLRRNNIEGARENYLKAIEQDPFDGRAYLGLSRIAQRKRDFPAARSHLRSGISRCPENPFLLQAMGSLEERVGHLAQAEAFYISSVRAQSTHAAAWVALAQLRTRKLRQGPNAGRICYQTAERELIRAGLPPNSFVYTAWASLEYKEGGNYKLAKELFQKAIEIDPRCSAAWLQLGVMEADKENWDEAQTCFETVLKFDKRNSRVLQAYAIAESRRPDGDSREAIDLFERALRVKPYDAGVYQAYALFVADLGDIDMARELFRRGSGTAKRHAPLWQAWGVLEMDHGTPDVARDVFQQGIWACAQSGGGQSGGRRCARLWQAWGVLESREGDYAAARRCFSRTLDAESRNVAAVTAWALMEESLGNSADARVIIERALKLLPPSSPDKKSLWRTYEALEENAGNFEAAKKIYQRALRETVILQESFVPETTAAKSVRKEIQQEVEPTIDDVLTNNDQVELIARWKNEKSIDFYHDVWMNDGSIEGKVPMHRMQKRTKQRKK